MDRADTSVCPYDPFPDSGGQRHTAWVKGWEEMETVERERGWAVVSDTHRNDRPKPLLVIVSGAPGSGKTTLAAVLARELRLPVLGKDAIKETLAESLGTPGTLAQAQALGGASFTLLAAVAGWMLGGGAGVILEANYRRGRSEPELRPLLVGAAGRLIQCEADPETILARYAARAGTDGRHPVHRDTDLIPRVAADVAGGHYAPLDLPIPTLRVRTDDGYAPDIAAVVRFVQDHG